MKKLLALLLTFSLTFTLCACGPDDPDGDMPAPGVPEDNLPEPAPVPETPDTPVTTIPDVEACWPVPFDTAPAAESVEIIEDLAFLEDRRVEMASVKDFLQTQFPEGCTVLDTFPVEGEGWRTTVVDLRGNTPIYSSHTIRVVPDGKYYTMEAQHLRDVTPAWQTVQAYRALYSALDNDVPTLLRQLGFDPDGGIILYNDFMEAILQVMTRDLYNTYWSRYFEADASGLLIWTEVAGSGTFYAVDRVEPRGDGSWLSYEHYYDGGGLRHDFTVRVELNESENGFVVADWASQNEQVYDTNKDGLLQTEEYPAPTGEALGLSGEDARLYTAIAQNLLQVAYPENADFDCDLVLPSLYLYGKYEGKAGVTHYVCRLTETHYYNAGKSGGLQPTDNVGTRSCIARISLHESGALAEFLATEDGSDNVQRLQEIFGPLKEELRLLETDQAITGARDVTPGADTLLLLYRVAYFPGT